LWSLAGRVHYTLGVLAAALLLAQMARTWGVVTLPFA
jgi:hypothetical protein